MLGWYPHTLWNLSESGKCWSEIVDRGGVMCVGFPFSVDCYVPYRFPNVWRLTQYWTRRPYADLRSCDGVFVVHWNHVRNVVGPIDTLRQGMRHLWTVSSCLPPYFARFVPGMLANVCRCATGLRSKVDYYPQSTWLATKMVG